MSTAIFHSHPPVVPVLVFPEKPDFRELFIPVCPAVCVTHRHPDSSLGGQNPTSKGAEHDPRALNETSRFPKVLEDKEVA